MIQRVQTLYMLASALLSGIVLLVPMAHVAACEGQVDVMSYGMRLVSSEGAAAMTFSWWSVCTGILTGICTLLPLATVPMFRRRILQMRLLAAGCVLSVCTALFAAGYIFTSVHAVAAASAQSSITYTPVLLLVSAGASAMAFRAVARDEALVRSLDRLR